MKKETDLLKNKNLMVIGLGKTGISVIRKIIGPCASITAIDSNPGLKPENELKDISRQERKKIKIVLGSRINEKDILSGINLVIISPGVPGDISPVRLAVENKIPVWSELELAWRLLGRKEQKRTIAVTGTNGKTTVVTLIGKILGEARKNCVVCGNVGLPLIDTVDINGGDKRRRSAVLNSELIRVIEVSSFQLERIYEFKPHISAILNVTSDHIDRHKTFENYGDLKLKILINQNKDDHAVINVDDNYIIRKIKKILKTVTPVPEFISYSLKPEIKSDIFYRDGQIIYCMGGTEGKIKIKNPLLKGNHNISNIMASSACALLSGVRREKIEEAVKNFKPLSHRLEYLGYAGGIRCFNDSKSTNPDATRAALNDFGREITLIMGGRDKDMDFSCLIGVLNKKVKNLILIGEASPRIYEQIIKNTYNFRIFKCSTLEEAVSKGFEVTEAGEVLILSPACASMDMFKDYKERGDRFKELVLSKNKT